jgi:dynein heavy chain
LFLKAGAALGEQ